MTRADHPNSATDFFLEVAEASGEEGRVVDRAVTKARKKAMKALEQGGSTTPPESVEDPGSHRGEKS